MSERKILLSAHNPMTGPRNLAHYICISDYTIEQDAYKSYYVIDDLAAYIMYPASRDRVLNRAFFTIKDFLAAGVDPNRSCLVLTSMLPEAFELSVLLNMYIDLSYCEQLYKESFCGRLLTYQREQIGFGKYPSVTEVVYTQTALAALTLGLRTDVFTGGEEMLGYLPILQELVTNFNRANGDALKMPTMDLVKYPFVLGSDGRHMMTDNAVFLSADPAAVRSAVEAVSENTVLKQWYEALGKPDLAKQLATGGAPSNKERSAAADYIVEKLERFRTFKITNEEILDIVRAGARDARNSLAESCLFTRGALGLPPDD